MLRAFSTASRTSSRLISRERDPSVMPPWLFTPRMCEPATPTTACSTGACATFSASSTAFLMESTALSRSAITPLRMPRESEMPWPR